MLNVIWVLHLPFWCLYSGYLVLIILLTLPECLNQKIKAHILTHVPPKCGTSTAMHDKPIKSKKSWKFIKNCSSLWRDLMTSFKRNMRLRHWEYMWWQENWENKFSSLNFSENITCIFFKPMQPFFGSFEFLRIHILYIKIICFDMHVVIYNSKKMEKP